ncbi:MAG TPA: OsmC family protein [Polyangia bacterium]|jgi:organic hydroperoxide reductase OsmC/OhrA|nr:OsmC family protein [Polyangia bacterium]
MSQHTATIKWTFGDGDFGKGRYSREHTWTFDGGHVVNASSSPTVVPIPMSNPSYVDPEEAFVASLSSCHMLTFLYVASRKGFTITEYVDEAVGTMTKNEAGTPWISSVVLRPRIAWAGDKKPTPDEEHALHEAAHAGCFIAQSVKTDVRVEPAG